MSAFALLLLFFLFLSVVAFILYLALSSCLGDNLRRGIRNGSTSPPITYSNSRPSYGRNYLRSISTGGWEGIEMSGIIREEDTDESDDGL